MAHRINIEDGTASMMYVGREPWHGLGTRLKAPATAAEAIRAAHLDWKVKKVPLYAWGEGIAYPMGDTFAVVPEKHWGNETCATWGPVGPNYTPLQNSEAFEFFDGIVGKGAAIYHTAGALDDGRRVWVLAKLPDDIKVLEGDITEKYLLLSNSHDASGSVQIKFTPTRVVCHNTLTMALQCGDKAIRVPHTRDIKVRLEVARLNLKLIHTTYKQIEDDFAVMVKTRLGEPLLSQYLKLVFPDPTGTKDPRAVERAKKDRARAQELFTRGKGNDIPGVAGTLWAAYNGVTEMVDHGRNKRTPEQHLDYIWFGAGYGIKARAFEVAKTIMQPEAGS